MTPVSTAVVNELEKETTEANASATITLRSGKRELNGCNNTGAADNALSI
jgi:hypothetical protein